MSEVTVGLVVLLGLFLTGIELSFCMTIVGFVGFACLSSFSAASNLVVKDFFDTFTSYGYTVIPLFVLMGQIASNSNIAKKLYMAAHKWVGHVPGGLAMTTVVGATIFKAMCGSTLATVATFSSIAIPEMERHGYDRKLSTGVVASVGTIGMLIPPSIVLIIYGIIVEQSIGRLFLAGIVPGLLISFFFTCIVFGWVKINPALAPRSEKESWKERIKVLPVPRWMVMVLIIVVYLIGGSFIDDLAFMILATPIFYPAVIKLGYDPVWFGIMIGITIMIGVIIPPVAICVFIVRNITGIPFNVIYQGVLPFLLALFACALLLFIFPQIALFLPNFFMGAA
jgi:TRAP-type C4-dicarboxylate transport system permease large subunit